MNYFDNKILLILCLFYAIVSSCKEDKYNGFYYDKNNLVKEFYDSIEEVKIIKYYTKDTIADGAEIWYYSNGKISKWLWFNKKSHFPLSGVYYNQNGNANSIKGDPFLSSTILKDGLLYIETIAPPNTKYEIMYIDSLNGIVKRISIYEPEISGQTSWVQPRRHKFEAGHKYDLYFYLLDNNEKGIDSAHQILLPPD